MATEAEPAAPRSSVLEGRPPEPGGSGQPNEFRISPPVIGLPAGGGAIRGIGEKFAANPVTGSASFSIPLPASPGRNGFGPQLALQYDSGNGNGPFGFGWSLGLPSISRKTEKGLPRYADGTDTFLIAAAEDLVPVLDVGGDISDDTTTMPGYAVRRYRPRIEGSFVRIERWTRRDGDVHWRSWSTDNVLSIYGKDASTRIQDPDDASRVFSWLISETRDDKGNAVVYEYEPEDAAGVDLALAHEQCRGDAASAQRQTARYPARIRYGNRRSLLDPATHLRPREVSPNRLDDAGWMFDVIFDYGQRSGFEDVGSETWTCRPSIAADRPRPVRPDPFSSYRSGFEVRHYRRCARVLMVHHFPQDAAVGPACLVRSLELVYRETPREREHSDPGFSFLDRAARRSYQRDPQDPTRYRYRSLPPLELRYSEAAIDDRLRDLDDEGLANLPVGLGAGHRWIDLDGEGLSGVLTEQAGAWFYKANLGAGPAGPRFAPLREVAPRPSLAGLESSNQQLIDVAGNGRVALVELGAPLSGYHQRTDADGWERFVAFTRMPNVDWTDPNLRFVDLTGDGLADAVITEQDVLTWYPSQSTQGFGAAQRSAVSLDERDGPRVVFADLEETIFLADMSGDGLSDIVRIRNGHTCYWPNLGYGRFGRQVSMDGSPYFDEVDQFDPRRIRLADVDGSGTVDLLYLGRAETRLWFNRSGNEWAAPRTLRFPTATANVDQIQVADLLGNGTACLVWSSELPADAARPIRYLDLMGGTKPHLLVAVVNNLGAETTLAYTPSTVFYLADRAAGTPWATRLPFPVHCLAKVTVRDRHRRTEFSTTYSYHHGYFDGDEREFRGFGRVEQVDCERFDDFAGVNVDSPYVTTDRALFQPPTKTVTWFSTGIAADRERVLGLFAGEYFPARFAGRLPGDAERAVPQPAIDAPGAALSTDEVREAMRACKGLPLRQETYELDIDALHERDEHRPVRIYSAAQHTCTIRRVQARGPNPHSVFLVMPGEAITYHYELDLRGTGALHPDPRVMHSLTLRHDDFGRPRQSVAVCYPRAGRRDNDPNDPAPLTAAQLALIRDVQSELHIAYTQTAYTDELPPGDDHRLPAPYEVRTFELTGIEPGANRRYFTMADLRAYRLDPALDTQANRAVTPLDYQRHPLSAGPHKRLVEHAVTLLLADDLSGPLAPRLPSRLGLTYENYKLALTESLLDDVFTTAAGQDAFDVEARAVLAETATRPGFLVSGYATGRTVLGPTGAGQWWVRSGVAGFAPDAPAHFYLPERYLDPFGNESSLRYDDDDLFVRSSTDPVGNATDVLAFDHRVLAPARMRDANRNVSEVAFDILGLPVAMALRGKVPAGAQSSETGDGLAQFSLARLNPQPGAVAAFFTADPFEADRARRWLGTATARFVYHLGDSTDAAGRPVWGDTAAGACVIQRERHERDAPNTPAAAVAIQVSFAYSDGAGQSFVTKNQAEPDPAGPGNRIRWIANGMTIVNNKGSPVLQYEPYFADSGHRFAEPHAVGVSAILYYDAAGRTIRTEFPDGSLARVDVTPWRSVAFDRNDTVTDPGNRWYAAHAAGAAAAEDRRAARLAAMHGNTPTETHVDSLGRAVVTIARNRGPAAGPVTAPSVADVPWTQERLLTFTKLDAEGKPLFVRDARGNHVMSFLTPPGDVPGYDIAGNLLVQHSMDAGDRRMLADGAGQPLLAWDYNERRDATTPRVFKEHRRFRVRYDALRRPLERRLRIRDETSGTVRESLVERSRYGEDAPGARAHNLRGRVWQHYDSSGLAQTDDVDLGGRALVTRRRLASSITAAVVDWDGVQVDDIHRAGLAGFERDVFTQRGDYDVLGRITRLFNWHVESPRGSGRSDRVAVYLPTYNQRGMLAAETVLVRARKTPAGHDVVPFVTRRRDAVTRIDYDAKGQKLRLDYGNGTVTRYDYDPDTFRLRELRTTRPGYDPRFPSERGRLSDARVLQHLYYTYDPTGNITEIRDDAWTPAFFANQRVEAAGHYVYDALYRLIEASGREDGRVSGAPAQFGTPVGLGAFPDSHPDAVRKYIERYRYDAVGNLESMRHIAGPLGTWTRTYDYANANNRLLSTDTDNPGRHVTYGYDTHGSMANLNAAPERFDLRWDWNDMIHTIDLGGGGRAWYQYGSDKQRCRKRIDKQHGSTGYWERIYLPGFELYRRYRAAGDAAPVEEIETHHLFERDQRVLQVDDVLTVSNPRPDGVLVKPQTLFRYQYSNLIGSACLELDHTAAVISYEEYHPYGSTAHHAALSTTEAPPKRYRYSGMERDEESGLALHGARHYVVWLARWASADPAGATDPTNRYQFVSGNPIDRVDTDGRADQKKTASIGDMAQHSKQGRAIYGPTGKRISEFEHIRARINVWLSTLDPVTGWSPYSKGAYRASVTLAIPEDMARVKTRMDLQLRDRIYEAMDTGAFDDYLVDQMSVEGDIQRTKLARDQTILDRKAANQAVADLEVITDTKITETAHLQQSELFEVGKKQRNPIPSATDKEIAASVDEQLARFEKLKPPGGTAGELADSVRLRQIRVNRLLSAAGTAGVIVLSGLADTPAKTGTTDPLDPHFLDPVADEGTWPTRAVWALITGAPEPPDVPAHIRAQREEARLQREEAARAAQQEAAERALREAEDARIRQWGLEGAGRP